MTPMVQRGILTSQADIWVHLFPRMGILHWYWVQSMREYIDESVGGWEMVAGRSKDGSVTAYGYLIPRDLSFIAEVPVPSEVLAGYDWDHATDRQSGLVYGEPVFERLVAMGAVEFPMAKIRRLDKKQEQNAVGDFILESAIELKTEMLHKTRNLFVQTAEGGHQVHLKKDQAGIVSRCVVAVPELATA